MTNHIHDDRLDAALRTVDVADTHLTPDQRARKDALLTSLLAEPLDAPRAGSTSVLTPDQRALVVARRRRRRVTRLAVPLLAAASVGAWFAWPGHPGTGTGSGAAFASWTSTPSPVDARTRDLAEKGCRASLDDTIDHLKDATPPSNVDPASMRLVVAERRGAIVFLHLAGPDGSTQDCYSSTEAPGDILGSGGGLATSQSAPPRALAADQIEIAEGSGFSSGSSAYSAATGRVGSAVRAVVVHSAGRTATATVSNGYVAAWWPARTLPPNAPSPRATYDVTLADGRIIRDAPNLFYADDQEAKVGPRQVGRVSTGGGAGEQAAVVTLGGEVGAEVTKVVVHVAGRSLDAPLTDHVFSVELPDGTDTSSATFDLTLKDGTVLRNQHPIGH